MAEMRELSQGTGFGDPAAVSRRLQILIEMVALLNADRCATSLSAAIFFLGAAAWEKLLAGPITGIGILEALAETGDRWVDGHRGYVLGGCLRSFTHLEGMLEATDYLHRPKDATANDWTVLRESVYEIHGWRFAFRGASFRGRFEELCSMLSNLMKTELADIGVTVEHDGLKAYVKDLMDRWHGLGTPLMRSAARKFGCQLLPPRTLKEMNFLLQSLVKIVQKVT